LADSFVLLNDGTSFVLLNDGVSKVILLDVAAPTTGLKLEGTHPTQAIFGTRPEMLIPVEFSFKLISCLITKTGFRVCIQSVLRIPTKVNVKVKSLLIVTLKETFKVKSALLRESVRFNTIWKSALVIRESTRIGLFSTTSINKAKKLKELLKRKLKEMLEDG